MRFSDRGEATHSTMNTIAETEKTPQPTPRMAEGRQPFAYRRDYGGNRFVYFTLSSRARGLSIGVNLNPDKRCNFDCTYCEVDRRGPVSDSALDFTLMARELKSTLALVRNGRLRMRNATPRQQRRFSLKFSQFSGRAGVTCCRQKRIFDLSWPAQRSKIHFRTSFGR